VGHAAAPADWRAIVLVIACGLLLAGLAYLFERFFL
jgi:hypothetical protein